MNMSREIVMVNRAPVLTLWASIVAERLGYDRQAALSLGKALAGLNAQTKGRSLGIYKPPVKAEAVPAKKVRPGEEVRIELLGRPVPARTTEHGLRAIVKDRPIEPDRVERYLDETFGSALQAVEEAMKALALAFDPKELGAKAFSLYARFRPEIPSGLRGWGAKGELDISLIRSLAKKTQ